MELNLLYGLIAAFLGTVAMTVLMRASIAMGATNMPPMPLIQGAMVTDDPSKAQKIGIVTHGLVMGTVVFGVIYAGLFAALGTASWLAGVVIGAIHGVIAGLVLPMMGRNHPRMESASAFSGDTTVTHEAGRLRITRPDPFGINYGPMTPVGLLMAHVVFGLVVALVYGAVVG